MAEPRIKITVDDFKFDWDDNEENAVLVLTSEDGREIEVTVEREMAEEFVTDLGSFLGLEDEDDDDD